jgi:hypothetical protein
MHRICQPANPAQHLRHYLAGSGIGLTPLLPWVCLFIFGLDIVESTWLLLALIVGAAVVNVLRPSRQWFGMGLLTGGIISTIMGVAIVGYFASIPGG